MIFMKKTICIILCLFVAVSAVMVPACAQNDASRNAADALYQLKLFLGYGNSYGLEDPLTRNQGIVLLVRMLGREQQAQKENNAFPFTDVADFAAAHVGYAYKNKLANGYSETRFGGDDPLTDQQFYALALRALGFSDSGDDPDFTYEKSRETAYELGIAESAEKIVTFTRGDVVKVFWNALGTKMQGSDETLADHLMKQGVFTKTQWEKAVRIQKEGIREGDETGEKEPAVQTGENETPITPVRPISGKDPKPATPEKPEDEQELEIVPFG